ncbi:MAG: ABC transporter permease [Sphingobacteriales bacterium]|jgi:peptide/nickel transport system permease protein|nr:MAG: ABC transporter permease [Sphingobacteriales bacterium]
MSNNKLEAPMHKTWLRLKKNKPAIFSLYTIIIAIILAIIAPLISSDSTPNADDQVLELNNQSPGFSIQMLLIPKNNEIEKSNIFKTIVSGKENPYKMVPIQSYKFEGKTIVAQIYVGADRTPETKIFNLGEIIPDKSKLSTLSQDQLEKLIKDKYIIKKKYILGTDAYGRDILSRLLLGIRVSLTVGLVAVLISLTIGIFLGSIAGYYRGWLDNVIMWLINVIWSIPTILLAMAIRFAIGDKINPFLAIFIAVGLSMWVEVARMVRGQVLSVREMEYIQASKSLGYNDFRTILRHILPNIIGPILVVAAADFASAILIEAGLSFIGLGVKPPTPSWGSMLNEHRVYLTSNKAFLALAPGVCIMILVLAFNLLGSGLRDAFDVKGQNV